MGNPVKLRSTIKDFQPFPRPGQRHEDRSGAMDRGQHRPRHLAAKPRLQLELQRYIDRLIQKQTLSNNLANFRKP